MAAQQRFAAQPRVAIAGSEKPPFTPAAPTSPVKAQAAKAPAGKMSVTVVLKPKEVLSTPGLAQPENRLTRAAFARRHAADTASARLVKEFATEYGLTAQAGPGPGMMKLTGTVAAMQKAFAVKLSTAEQDGETLRVREGEIYLPQELEGHVLAVLGLDDRPQAQAHFRIVQPRAVNTSFTPVQVAQLYGYPAGASAAGQTIALIELGGGYRQADLTAYFKSLGQKAPPIVAVSVDGGKNKPTTASGADGEVMLDIEVAAAVAPGVRIAVYFAPNSDQGFVDAIATAAHDTVNKPSVISISWGGPESSWTGQAMAAMDAACQAAAAMGVTVIAACGDNGSTDGVAGTANHVDFPASSPHVLACGGTKLVSSGGTISSEVVWNELTNNEGATGGGVSAAFALPAWQKGVGVPAAPSSGGGRGVPDVAGNADPTTGYTVRVDGQSMVIGGTSAVAPLWAGLIALANAQNKSSIGFVNPALYAARKAFRDITQGDNGGFQAGPGWDACTGLGTPVGTAIIAALAPKAAAGKGKAKTSGGQRGSAKPVAVKKSAGRKRAGA